MPDHRFGLRHKRRSKLPHQLLHGLIVGAVELFELLFPGQVIGIASRFRLWAETASHTSCASTRARIASRFVGSITSPLRKRTPSKSPSISESFLRLIVIICSSSITAKRPLL